MTAFTSGGRAFDLSDDGRLARVVREERPISAAQSAMLRLFLRRPGQQVSEAELAQAAWGEPKAPDGAVEAQVRALCAAFGDDPAASLFIEALPQRGYRFTGGVTEQSAATAPRGQADPLADPPADPEATIRALCDALATPAACDAIGDARTLGARHRLGPAYDRAVQTLAAAAEAGRGEALPALALETVIDALQSAA